MRTLWEVLRRVAGSLGARRSDADLQEELRTHLELAAERDVPARRVSGGVAQAMDALRDQRGLPWFDALRSDLVFGWRQIVRYRIASVAAVLSLGLAMGAALTTFRLVDAVLLRPLPVADPSRLFVLTQMSHDVDLRPNERDDFDYPSYQRYIARAGDDADLMLVGSAVRRKIAIGAGELEPAVQQFVSGNVFRTLGLQPALGRLLSESDDTVPDGHPVVVMTYDYWQRRFGGDSAVIGRSLRISGRPYEIVGVVGPGFTGTEPGMVTDLFVPSMMNPEALKVPNWSWFRIWVRPKADVDPGRVRSLLQAGFKIDQAERAKGFPPDTPKARIDAFFEEHLDMHAAGAGVSATQKAFGPPLWILATLATLLVLMACANVANLLLARATSRKIEMALRLSIGAARRRLVQLLLVESALLAFLAAGVGALFTWWAAPFVVSMLATPDRPLRVVLPLDWRTLLMATTLTLLVTILFGLAPAIRGSAAPLVDALKETRGRRGHRRLADALVAAQAALCVFLLMGAALFVGSLQQLQNRPLGFAPDNVLQVVVDGRKSSTREDWAQLAGSLAATPGVESVAVAGWAPLSGNRWRSTVIVAGGPAPEDAPNWVGIGPGYIGTLQMRLLEGRDFGVEDRPAARDATGQLVPGVAIVNEAFARVYFGGRSPVGQRVIVESSKAPMEVVGLVADSVYYDVRETNHPAVFIPLGPRTGATILVRTESAALELGPALVREIARLRPDLQVWEATPFKAKVTLQMIRERLVAALSTFFAVLALVLAAVGLYGVLNYAVTRERREIGLRLALGARPAHVVTLLTTRLAGMVVIGAIAGIGSGMAVSRFVQTLLFQITPTDPAALMEPLVILAAASFLAVLAPAIRAVRTNPAQTIKVDG
jgi:putative ABC transport system permease protein